jgi:hypothetical protein
MKNKVWTLIVWLGLALGGSQAAQAQMERVIDNFISNGPTRSSLVNDAKDFTRFGDPLNIIGGFRLTRFGVAPIAGGPARATLLDIPAGGPMFVESGVNSSVGVELDYGNGTAPGGRANPLNLNLPGMGFDRFRIEFGACDLELNYLVQVFDGNGNNSLLSGTMTTANQNLPFNRDFIFTDFPPGAPNPVDWSDIDSISIQLNTGNATGGQDFMVKRIVATYGP